MKIINKIINKYVQPRVDAQLNDKFDAQVKENTNIKVTEISQKIKAQLGYGGYGGSINNIMGMSRGEKFLGGLSGTSFFVNHFTTRQKARIAYQESLQAKALVDRYADTVADVGLMLDPTPVSDLIGLSSQEAEKWARNVEQRFDLWARDKKQHRSGTMTFYQAHRFYQISQHRDNDVFVRLYYSQDKSLQNPLQFDFLDPDQIRGDALTSSYGLQCRNDGIERDSQGREKSYKIWVTTDGITYKAVDIPRIGPKSKRIMMLHGFMAEYAGQGRGFSRLAHALQEFQNITDFTAAQLQKAIINSSINAYVKPSPDNPASNIFDGVSGPHTAVEQFGSDPTPAADALNVSIVKFQDVPEARMRKPGAFTVTSLQEGEDLKEFGKGAPSDSFDAFVGSLTSYLSAAFSMPIEVLLMKFNSNYSASRGALILFWRIAQIWREEMAADFLNQIYEMWLSGEIAAGRISAPGWLDPRIKNAWLRNNWIGSPMPNIDPMRTAKATQTQSEMGLITLGRAARELNGSNAQSNRQKIAKEFSEITPSPFNSKGNS